MKIINLISGPRNLSTALMYSFSRRPDTKVIDEPFYAHYLETTGIKHPAREDTLNSMSSDITEVLESQSALRSKHDTTFVSEIPGRRPTKYEQKAREAGSKIRFYEWVKNPAPLDAVREEKIEDMPNALLEGEIDVKDLMKDLGSKTWKLKDQGVIVVVKLGHIYREEPSGNLLLEVMVREGAFSQHFGIVAVQRPPNRLLVKLSPIGYPRPTWGVKQAVRLVSERLLERANLTVVSSTLAEPVVPDG